jgi:hypothetical protein
MIGDVAKLIHAIAWPATVLIAIFLLRKELRDFMGKLTNAIGQAAQISIGTKGLAIKLGNQIAAVNTRVTAVQATQEQVKTAVSLKRSARRTSAERREIPRELNNLADKYLKLQIADYRDRVRRKNEIAREMGELVIEASISRDRLVAANNEGLTLAFAAAVIAQPKEQDFDRIIQVAPKVTRLHVRYWLVLALSVLINGGPFDRDRRPELERTLEQLDTGADKALSTLIQDTKKLLDSVLSGEIQAGV